MQTQKTTQTQAQETVTVEATATNNGTFEQSSKSLPALRDASGNEVSMSIANIQDLGKDAGNKIGKLSDDILSRVKIADSGELGQGINSILTLTRKVDVSKLGEKNDGFVGRIWNIFGDTKQKVLDQFETSADQIERISGTLVTGVNRMRGETQWLENTYNANIEYLRELERILESIDDVLEVEEANLAMLQGNPDVALEILQEKDMLVETLSKQADKLRRLAQIARLTAPQIQSMRKVNSNTIEKFTSLHQTIIPLWKQNMSYYLISLQQGKDNELSNAMDDETNRLLTANSKNVADNMKAAARANQRGVIDIKTLQQVQTNMLNGINETMAIEQAGRVERENAKIEMTRMNEELKAQLRSVADRSNNNMRRK